MENSEQNAPKVTLEGMKAKIAKTHFINLGDAARCCAQNVAHGEITPMDSTTLCILVMKSGFTVIGKSACASPENYNEELGHKYAFEDAINQLWPLEGYLLKSELAGQI